MEEYRESYYRGLGSEKDKVTRHVKAGERIGKMLLHLLYNIK